MDIHKAIYMISCIILWICIFMNIYQIRRMRRLSNEYVEAITAAFKARDNYEQLCQNLNEERDYFRNLKEEEASRDEQV